MSLVVLQFVGQFTLVTQSCVVDERESRQPVAVLQFSVTLYVVLSSCEVPHEVSPVHEVTLVGEEEVDILQLRGHVYGEHLSAAVVWHVGALWQPRWCSAHPALVCLCVPAVMHTWEQHVLCVFIVHLVTYHEVRVFLICRCFLFLLIHGCPLDGVRLAVVAVALEEHLRGVCLSVEQWPVAILVTAEVTAQGEDILW